MHNLFYRNSDEKSLKHGLLLFKVWKVNLTVRVICHAIFAFLLTFYLTALNESLSKTMDGWELSMQSIKTAFCFIYLSFIIYTAVGNDEGSTQKIACIRQRYRPFLLFLFSYFLIFVLHSRFKWKINKYKFFKPSLTFNCCSKISLCMQQVMQQLEAV